MIFDPSSAGLSEVHRSKFGLVLIAFAFVCLRVEFLLQLLQPEQTVNADEPNIPSVTGAANLSFKIAGVAATHDKQDGAVWLLHPLLGDEVSSVAGNCVQINA